METNIYSQGKIYKLESPDTDRLYVGSTTQTLQKRFKTHRYKAQHNIPRSSNKMFEYADTEITLIENFPCLSREELRGLEIQHAKTKTEILLFAGEIHLLIHIPNYLCGAKATNEAEFTDFSVLFVFFLFSSTRIHFQIMKIKVVTTGVSTELKDCGDGDFEIWTVMTQEGLKRRLDKEGVKSLVLPDESTTDEFAALEEGGKYCLGAAKAQQGQHLALRFVCEYLSIIILKLCMCLFKAKRKFFFCYLFSFHFLFADYSS